VDKRDGKLYLYPGTANATLGARVVIGTGGWNSMDKLAIGKFNRDDNLDLIAVDKRDAKLYLYPGTATGTLGTRVEVGPSGWNGRSEVTAGRFNADEYDDLITTENASGKLFLYPGTAAGGKFGGRIEIGIGG